jgi:hypothetical protein
MKSIQNLYMASAAALLLMAPALGFANEQDSPLPAINNISLQQSANCDSGACTEIMPYLDIEFSHTSCGKKTFDVSAERRANIIFLRILDKNGTNDCRGPAQVINYHLDITDMHQKDVRYVILNPLAP